MNTELKLQSNWAFICVYILALQTMSLVAATQFTNQPPAGEMADQLSIVSPPKSQTCIHGATAIFTVIANGETPLKYQWLRNEVPLASATNDVLIMTNAQFSDAGSYSVVISNVQGAITSSPAILTVAWPKAGDVDTSFNPGSRINSAVRAMAMQPDGKVLIGGRFTSVAGASRGYLARLNPDGSTDSTFMNGMSGANHHVLAVAIQPDSKVVVGGYFTRFNGENRNYLVRLHPDGSVDLSFMSGMSGLDYDPYRERGVKSIIALKDGKILISGTFKSVNGIERINIARLNTDGSVDTGFTNSVTGLIGSGGSFTPMAIQPDGKLLFLCYYYVSFGDFKNGIARLNEDGSLDRTFQNGISEVVQSACTIVPQPDGKILVGGDFPTINGPSGILRLNADGSFDSTFMNGLSGISQTNKVPIVESIVLQTNGQILIGGTFDSVNKASRNRIARLNADGSLDGDFLNGLDGVSGGTENDAVWETDVAAIIALPNGKVLVGGDFTAVNGTPRAGIARLNYDGTCDGNFLNVSTGPNKPVNAIAIQTNGQVLIGGKFTSLSGTSRGGVARLNTDGSLDTGFMNGMLGATGSPYGASAESICIQKDGKILIGGSFTNVNGVSRNSIARINMDGSLDTNFLSGMSGAAGSYNAVRCIIVQPDDKILVGGSFTHINGAVRQGVGRLNSDGSLDTSFLDGMGGAVTRYDSVKCIQLQPDGRVLVGGGFYQFNGMNRMYLVRLNTDGSVDTDFACSLNSTNNSSFGWGINSVAVQADGKIIIGGNITAIKEGTWEGIARLNADGTVDNSFMRSSLAVSFSRAERVNSLVLQPDGKLLVGGYFTDIENVTRGNIARLNTDGSVDTVFMGTQAGANFDVNSMALAPDGKICLAGLFGGINGFPTMYIARLWSESFVPEVSVQPQAQAVTVGIPGQFSVSMSGVGTLHYQWYKNSSAILGATAAKLILNNVQMSDAGNYFCVVSNAYGSVTSAVAALNVRELFIMPESPSVNGTNHVFQFSVQSSPGISYTIEVCSNLNQVRWDVLGVVTNGTGSGLVQDTNAFGEQRFYRLKKSGGP